MYNNYADDIPGMGDDEETSILDAIENDIVDSIKYTTVYMKSTRVNVVKTGVHVESTVVT